MDEWTSLLIYAAHSIFMGKTVSEVFVARALGPVDHDISNPALAEMASINFSASNAFEEYTGSFRRL